MDSRISFKFGGRYSLRQGNTCPAFQEIRSSKPEMADIRIKSAKGTKYVLRLPKFPLLWEIGVAESILALSYFCRCHEIIPPP